MLFGRVVPLVLNDLKMPCFQWFAYFSCALGWYFKQVNLLWREAAVEQKWERQEVCEIARQTGHSEQEVETLFEEVLISLSRSARIKDYVRVLAIKRVRKILRDIDRHISHGSELRPH
jgi:hypothetical protein